MTRWLPVLLLSFLPLYVLMWAGWHAQELLEWLEDRHARARCRRRKGER